MATASTTLAGINQEDRDLKNLEDAFGSSFSLEEINAAFSNAGRDVNLAGESLNHGLQAKSLTSSEILSSDSSRRVHSINGDVKYKSSRPKKHVVSMGTVSNVIDRSYVKSTPRTKPNNTANYEGKSLVVQEKMLSSEGYANEDFGGRISDLHSDYEEFIVHMLRQGFELDRTVIQEVLAQCEYDMTKSLDQLFDLTRDNLDEGHTDEKITENPCKQLQNMNNVEGSFSTSFEDKLKQSKEVLTSLFDVSKYLGESPKKIKRSTIYAKPVETPPSDVVEVYDPTIPTMEVNYEEEVDSGYNALRCAVKDYRGAMRDYYEAAAEAFAKGDFSQATTLREKGMLFCQKAREADEESYKIIFTIRLQNDEEAHESQGDTVPVDLQNFGAKEAIANLKCQLRSLSGIPTICHLKLILGMKDKDDYSKRRKVITRLLEKESVEWTEDSSTGTIMVRVDTINPDNLSFAKKH